MIQALITVLVWLIVLAIIYYIAQLAITTFGGPPILLQIFGLILLLIFILVLFNLFTGTPAWSPSLRLRP